MPFIDAVRTLANQLSERRSHIQTEEAVKQALILPFFSLLGYDIYNPAELVPEFRAGWAKAMEKVDYGIQLSGKLAMLVEAKGPNETLANYDAQLAKYFNSTPEVKFAIITNGFHYKFFTDLQEKNILDKNPFFEFNFDKFDDHNVVVLENFRKDVFSAEKLVSYAEDLVYLSKLKDIFKKELREPSESFIRFALDSAKIVDGRITQSKIERFEPLIKQSISTAILEIVGQSFQPAPVPVQEAHSLGERASPPSLAITEDELKAYTLTEQTVRAFVLDASRLRYVKGKTYLSLLYSNNWFMRYTIDSRLKRAVYFRLPMERVKELAPSCFVEEAPEALGSCRVYFDSVNELCQLERVFIEAVRPAVEK